MVIENSNTRAYSEGKRFRLVIFHTGNRRQSEAEFAVTVEEARARRKILKDGGNHVFIFRIESDGMLFRAR